MANVITININNSEQAIGWKSVQGCVKFDTIRVIHINIIRAIVSIARELTMHIP